jgi:hypothetical protein
LKYLEFCAVLFELQKKFWVNFMFKKNQILYLTIFVLTLASAADAGERSIRKYLIPDHGVLELNVPITWKDMIRQPPGNLPPTITFRPGQGNEFVMMITPLWSLSGEKNFNSPEKVRALVDRDRCQLAPKSVEKEIRIKEIQGAGTLGYYFLATDSAPQPGEWEYLVRAGLGVGDFLLSVTILSHQKDSEGIRSGLTILREARHLKGG